MLTAAVISHLGQGNFFFGSLAEYLPSSNVDRSRAFPAEESHGNKGNLVRRLLCVWHAIYPLYATCQPY